MRLTIRKTGAAVGLATVAVLSYATAAWAATYTPTVITGCGALGSGQYIKLYDYDACGGPAITLSPNTSGLIPAGFDNLAESFNLRGGNCIWFTDLSTGGGDATTEVCNNGASTTKLSFEIPSGFDNKASRYYAS